MRGQFLSPFLSDLSRLSMPEATRGERVVHSHPGGDSGKMQAASEKMDGSRETGEGRCECQTGRGRDSVLFDEGAERQGGGERSDRKVRREMLDPKKMADLEQGTAGMVEVLSNLLPPLYESWKEDFTEQQAWELTKVAAFALCGGKGITG